MRPPKMRKPEEGRVHATRVHLAFHVRRLREERGWSQLDLAGACGLHRTHVSRLENALYNASIYTVDNIAEAFGVAPFLLLQPPALQPDNAHFVKSHTAEIEPAGFDVPRGLELARP